MALETVIYQQDPFIYNCKEIFCNSGAGNYSFVPDDYPPPVTDQIIVPNVDHASNAGGYSWESPPSSVLVQNSTAVSSPENFAGDGFFNGGMYSQAKAMQSRRKRRRTRSLKNKEEMENQRMTHIAVERNRRRQMNDYLAVLRSLMPPSYAQRGDQASIVGGAINFVKELEQLLQFLESKKPIDHKNFSKFFTFPQYSKIPVAGDTAVPSSVAEVEVTVVESHANIKILTKRRPKQVLKLVAGLHTLSLTILHLNITAVDPSALYCFSVKVEEECQLRTANEIATAVHDMVEKIQNECEM